MIRAALLGYAIGVAASLSWLPRALRTCAPWQREWIALRRRS